jgi:hypothetical protein
MSADQPAPAVTYTCLRCAHAAPWTDGQSRDAGDPVDEFWCQHCGYEQPLPPPDQPARAGDDELREAERLLSDIPEGTPAVLVEEATATVLLELERLREIERRARDVPRCTCDYSGLEVEPHKSWCEVEGGPHAECRARHDLMEAELAELRARDEAAKAVVQTWRSGPARTGRNGDPLWQALDALARAHDEDGGQDR